MFRSERRLLQEAVGTFSNEERNGVSGFDANAARALIHLKETLLARRDELDRQVAEIDRQLKGLIETAGAPGDPTPGANQLPPPPAASAVPPVPPPPVADVPEPPEVDVDDPQAFPRIIDFLMAQIRKGGGTIDLDGCATRLYGSYSEKNRNRVSRILNYMVRRAMIQHAGRPRTYLILGPVP